MSALVPGASAAKSVGEVALRAKGAHPGSIIVNGWQLTYMGEADASNVVAQLAAEEAQYQAEMAELERRWPLSQRRVRCPDCGAFTKDFQQWRTWRCKRCGSTAT